MKRKIKRWAGAKLCDIGLWVLNLGPKDETDRRLEKELIALWRKFQPKCMTCGQEDVGQTGEYACEECGLPRVHDALEGA